MFILNLILRKLVFQNKESVDVVKISRNMFQLLQISRLKPILKCSIITTLHTHIVRKYNRLHLWISNCHIYIIFGPHKIIFRNTTRWNKKMFEITMKSAFRENVQICVPLFDKIFGKQNENERCHWLTSRLLDYVKL